MLRFIANPWFVVAAGAIILMCNMGIRQTIGLLLPDINISLDISMTELSLGFGVQNLIWGAVSPIAGLLAERFGTVRVLLVGGLFYALGLVVAAIAESSMIFFIGNSVLIGIGTGATVFPIVLGAVGRRFPTKHRTLALGVTSAGGSLGQFAYAMLHNQVSTTLDWHQTYLLFAVTLILLFLFIWPLTDEKQPQSAAAAKGFDWQAIGQALRSRDYLLLNIGFFVCGFHIAFLTVHMAGMVSYCGLPPSVAGDSLALIGLINIGGGVLAGWAGDRWHKPGLLVLIYWARACLIMGLLLISPSSELFYIFGALMGMLWLSTVPVTSGIIADIFGTKNLASLFGIVMFSHQIGAFFGSWFGGLSIDLFGSYDFALMISAGLGLLAAAVHLPITPKRMRQYQMSPA